MTESQILILVDAIQDARAYIVVTQPGTMEAANLLEILDAALEAASKNKPRRNSTMTEEKIRYLIAAIEAATLYIRETKPGKIEAAILLKILDSALEVASEDYEE